VPGIEGLAALPDGKGAVQQLAQGVADGDGLLVGMPGNRAGIQGADGGVATDGAAGGHPQVPAHPVAAGAGDGQRRCWSC
jgi:hypothetical protein